MFKIPYEEIVFRQGLAHRNFPKGIWQTIFYFDLNNVPYYVPDDASVIQEIVDIARSTADSDKYGPHNEILSLRAYKYELESPDEYITWYRGHHVQAEGTISLADWIEKNKKE